MIWACDETSAQLARQQLVENIETSCFLPVAKKVRLVNISQQRMTECLFLLSRGKITIKCILFYLSKKKLNFYLLIQNLKTVITIFYKIIMQ